MNPKGKKSVKKTTEEFKQEVYDRVGKEYQVLGEYTGTNNKLEMLHVECGTVYHVTPNKFLQGRRCPTCNKTRRKTTEEFKQEVNKKFNGEIEVLGEYKDNKTKILVKYSCGHEGMIPPNTLLSNKDNSLCGECMGTRKYSDKEFKEIVKNKVGDSFTVLGKYKNKRTKILFRHEECGLEFYDTPDHVIQRGIKCKCQTLSKPEILLKNILDKHGYSYSMQTKVKNLKYEKQLRFDFCVYINKKYIFIEYDGGYHFDKLFVEEETFNKARERDLLKNKFCKDNNIPLLRIPYWKEKDMEKILLNVLNRLDTIYDTVDENNTDDKYFKKEIDYLLL